MRHHYIPEFYLRRWAALPGKQLVEFSRPYTDGPVRPHRKAPKGTGFVEGLYELRGFPPDLKEQLEEGLFRPIDGRAADALDLMERRGNAAKWTAPLRQGWSQFLVSLLLRCPEDIRQFREGWFTRYFQHDDDFEARYSAIRKDTDPATWAEYVRAEPPMKQEASFGDALIKILNAERTAGRLMNYPWRVVDLPERAPDLLTSDRPVIRTSGLNAPMGHMVLAVGPRRIFAVSPKAATLLAIEGSNLVMLAREHNRQVVQGAVRFAYGNSDAPLDFVRKHFSTVEQPRIMTGLLRKALAGRSMDDAQK